MLQHLRLSDSFEKIAIKTLFSSIPRLFELSTVFWLISHTLYTTSYTTWLSEVVILTFNSLEKILPNLYVKCSNFQVFYSINNLHSRFLLFLYNTTSVKLDWHSTAYILSRQLLEMFRVKKNVGINILQLRCLEEFKIIHTTALVRILKYFK